MSIIAEITAILERDDVEELRDIVETLDILGSTILHEACYQNSIECVKFLIDEGFDLNAKNDFGNPPLTYACWGESREAVRLLLEAGAEPLSREQAENYPDLLTDEAKHLLAEYSRI